MHLLSYSKMKYCSVSNCRNAKEKPDCRGKTFFGFPRNNPSLIKIWLQNIGRPNMQPSAYSSVCSDHFEEACFTYQPFTNRRQLKTNSVPTKFCFSEPSFTPRILQRTNKSSVSQILNDIPKDISTEMKEKLQAETTDCPSSWRYYARIDKILGNCPIIDPGKKLEFLTIKTEPSDDENVLSNSESNDCDNGILPLISEVLAPNDEKYNQGKKRSHDEEENAEENKETQNMLDIIENGLEEYQAPRNKKYNQRKKLRHNEDDSTEESTGTRNILGIIENALEECKVLREEQKEINIKLVEVIERQNQLLEKLLEKL